MPPRTAGRIGLFLVMAAVLAACAPEQPSCSEPAALPVIDAFSATNDQMIAMRDRIVKYQKDNDAYQGCLVSAINGYVKSPPLSHRLFGWFYDDGYLATLETRKHEAQSSKEEIVGKFNDAVKAYNDLHPDK